MADCPKRSTPVDIGHKHHAIQAQQQPFDFRTYQNAIGLILDPALGTRLDVTDAMAVLG
jgi:hypothetical protein